MGFRWLRQLHGPFIFSILGLVVIGTIFIHSASHRDGASFLIRQCFWAGIGFAVLVLVPSFGYRTFLGMAGLFYLAALGMLLWVDLAGALRLGAQRWIVIGPLAVQPSEFAKLATVLMLANFLGDRNPRDPQAGTMASALILTLIPFAMILKQPDLGSAILLVPMAVALLFLWGMRKRYFVLFSLAAGVVIPLMWKFLRPYQKKRILVFLDPNQDPMGSGYTAIQSKIAVGSGGLFGKGYMAGTQSQLQFVPEHHTDFIFCVIGEEWGFLGAAGVLVLYGMLFRSAFQIMEETTDVKAKLLIAGISSMMFVQLFINIGMSFGLMPIAGITLPLISYGGSSLVTTLLGLGLILSVYKERSIF